MSFQPIDHRGDVFLGVVGVEREPDVAVSGRREDVVLIQGPAQATSSVVATANIGPRLFGSRGVTTLALMRSIPSMRRLISLPTCCSVAAIPISLIKSKPVMPA